MASAMTFPDDFAAEWRAEEQAKRIERAALHVRLMGDFLVATGILAEQAAREVHALGVELVTMRRQYIAAQAERLSAWGPWR